MNTHETVYVAGPMSTAGEPGLNLHLAVTAAARLIQEGFLPFVPHLTWIQHSIAPWLDVEAWQKMTMGWVERCDILLRLQGESRGADREVERAMIMSIPVFYSIGALIRTYRLGR